MIVNGISADPLLIDWHGFCFNKYHVILTSETTEKLSEFNTFNQKNDTFLT